ncbi:hypothetical protein ISF_03938 [Cordyceps fumosorosea ARSEF 2679]|uniref:Uncharacterized protein n=1 Tax=Cordyceps fumosorosea (strain ARSEF 2679) TaxID=1081104 RepID=A0A162MS68_CORFA|nr:hypothetical protein ISF_03938 [Cordyceps fumosorosea ARSEF 2679]OAA66100.1 hypothetical protein ISF_03938 [Cordyceps fumosorosea ARSEF 2679]
MSRGGTALGLKTLQWLIRSVQLLCSVIILGIYSYLLAALSNHNLPTPTKVRAVEGIVGVAAAYALLGLLLLCCLAGRTLTSFAAMCLDFAFLCAYIFVAVANKDGAGSCTGEVTTVFGKGKAGDTLDAGGGFTKIPSYRSACKLETACLAIAIIAIFFYIFSIFIELALGRNHQREKRLANSPPPPMQMPYAQGPYDNYQPGPDQPESPRRRGFLGRIFGRDRGQQPLPQHDPNNLPQHAQPIDVAAAANRDSQATAIGHEHDHNKYETGYDGAEGAAAQNSPMATGHTAPTTYTYTSAGDPYAHAGDPYAHAGESYAHAGDRFGHAGDDYLQYRPAAGSAEAHSPTPAPAAATALPYPADDPYEPRRAERPSHQMSAPRYPAPSYRYDDGIYDRP